MITFKRFLSEEHRRSYSFEEGIKLIKQNCQNFISLAGDDPLYRGFGKYSATMRDILELPHPENRRPRNSDRPFNFLMNLMFNLAFGIEDVRKRSIFVTGDFSQAEMYGELMFCFPAGKIRWLWSPEIQDLLSKEYKLYQTIAERVVSRDIDDRLFGVIDIEQIFNKLEAVYHDPHALINDLRSNAGRKTSKIISDVIPNLDEKTYDSLVHAIISEVTDITHEEYLDTMQLNKAISAFVEIMIYESAGYYLVPVVAALNMAEKEGIKLLSDRKNLTIYRYVLKKIKES